MGRHFLTPPSARVETATRGPGPTQAETEPNHQATNPRWRALATRTSPPLDQVEASEREADQAALRVLEGRGPIHATPQPLPEPRAHPSVEPALVRRPGRPLEPELRRPLEQGFGADFSNVRVHTDALANDEAQSLGARAYTYGRHIGFREGAFAPDGGPGRRVLAHELAHVVQQGRSGRAEIQRFAECGTPSECPARDPGELAAALRDPMIVTGIANPDGLLVANFAVGSAAAKPGLAGDATFLAYTTAMAARPQTRFEILGFSDCEGEEVRNTELRLGRAEALHATLPAAAQAQIGGVGPAPLSSCIHSNDSIRGRSLNRSALIRETGDVYEFEEERIEANPNQLYGMTSQASEYNVRASPGTGGAVVGRLALQEMHVDVVGEHGADVEALWLQVRFTPADFAVIQQNYIQAGGTVPAWFRGTTAWVHAAALGHVAMPYAQFLSLVDAFDAAHAGEALRDRLTRLRQIGEDASLSGDAVVGRGGHLPGIVRQTDRTNNPSQWELLLEAKQVIMPNMEVVDIHHFILGLDALALPASQTSANRRINLFVNVGESFSAATWSGDVGGAVGDYVRHASQAWERANTSQDTQARRDFYFRTRAPEMDLLADIDAWGAFGHVPQTSTAPTTLSSLRALFELHYGAAGQTAAQYEATVAPGRRAGVSAFLCFYGFRSPTGLRSQTSAFARVEDQVRIFGRAWYDVQSGTATAIAGHTVYTEISIRVASRQMTEMYLDWLEALARRVGLTSLQCPS